MERLGTVEGMRARLEAMQARHAEEHARRMASLPAGTCDTCYGEGKLGGLACYACHPAQRFAEGTPVEFQGATFATYQVLEGNESALTKARAFLGEGRRDLYLCGGVGAGKTRLAASILNDAVGRGRWCYFARVPLMLHQLQPGRATEELEHKIMRCDLLLLDDIGAERDQATDYTRRTLLMIYEERGDKGHRTIFTSNKTLSEFAQMQDDDRLASRIAGRADVVRLTTPDQRMSRRRKQDGR